MFKKIIILACIVCMYACSQKEVPFTSLLQREGLYYEVNQETPYTGKVFTKMENGQFILTGTLSKGFKSGEWIEYFENGQKATVKNYANDGKLNGLSINYQENGQVYEEINYLDDKKNGSMKRVFPDGNYNITTYKDDIKEGKSVSYSKNKKLLYSTYFKDGKTHGEYKSYYEDTGKLKSSSNHKMGKLEGLKESFYRNGKIKSQIVFQNNRSTSKKKFDEDENLKFEGTFPGKVIYYKNNRKIAEGTSNWRGIVDIKSLTVWLRGKPFTWSILSDYIWTSPGKNKKNFSPVKGTYYTPTTRKRWFTKNFYYREADVGGGSYRPRVNAAYELLDDALPKYAIKIESYDVNIELFVQKWDGKTLEVLVNGRKEFWKPIPKN